MDSIIANDFPKEKLEVFVVDGMSDDGTTSIVTKYSEAHSFIKVLSNPKKTTPIAMNMGIKESIGDYIIILSSHSKIDKNFLRLNVESLNKYSADCVGGRLVTLPANKTLMAKAIAIAISHPFGVGNSYFRIGLQEPKYVDTVPFGCYKRETLNKIGIFDEDLVRNQDDELNLRLIKNGGKILLVPSIISEYVARDSLLKLWKMYYQYGYFKPLVAQKVGGVLTWRQLIPALMLSSFVVFGMLSFISHFFLTLFICILFLYLMANLFFSISEAAKKGLKYLFVLPAVFSTVHFSYGIGYLKGIWDFILFKKQNRDRIEDVPLSR